MRQPASRDKTAHEEHQAKVIDGDRRELCDEQYRRMHTKGRRKQQRQNEQDERWHKHKENE
jgi:hypothetical protein